MKKPKKTKKTVIKGEMHMYFATGEESRVQVIGDNSMNDKGMVTNYKEVYDIKKGDTLTIINDSFNERLIEVYSEEYNFLYNLCILWKTHQQPLRVEYRPGEKNRSWQEHVDSLKSK